MKERVIVLLSGGMDSLAVLAQCQSRFEDLYLLHLNYGQKTSSKEMECFHKIADHYEVPVEKRKVINMDFLKQIGGSSLTDDNIDIDDHSKSEADRPTSYVPFRNTLIIALAVSWAETIGAQKIFIGANEEDSPGYPDCREVYYQAYNELIKLGTQDGRIKVLTPIITMKKFQIVQTAQEHQAPLHLSWSCYARTDKACGVCDSCALRLKGFAHLKQKDPIPYL